MGLISQSISLAKKSSCLFKSNKQAETIAKSMTALTQKNLNNLDNEVVKKGLQDAFDFFSAKRGKSSQLRLTQIDDIIQKYTQCSDDVLKKELEDGFKWLSEGNKKTRGRTLDLLENSLDAFNSAEDLYSPLYNADANIGFSFVNKVLVSFAKFCSKVKKLGVNEKLKYLNPKEVEYSKPRQLYRAMKRENKHLNTDLIDFKNFAKFSPLEQFVLKYKDKQPELVEYLYKKSYLSKLQQPELKEFCERINKRFGIKTFDYTLYDFNKKSAYKIEKELEMFHKALKPNDKLIDILEISDFDFKYKLKSNIAGYYSKGEKLISMPTWKQDSTFRHELTHAIDKKLLKFFSKTTLSEQKLEEDLIKGLAPEGSINYAKTKLCETKAVLGEFYTPKYSRETKDFMVKNGLPKEILKLREVDFYDYIVNFRKYDKDSIKVFKQLRAKLGGKIPQEIADRILVQDTKTIEEVLKLTKKRNFIEPKLFTEILDCQTNILEKKHHIAKLKIAINNGKKMLLDPEEAYLAEEIKREIVDMSKKLEVINEDLIFTEDLLKQALSKC